MKKEMSKLRKRRESLVVSQVDLAKRTGLTYWSIDPNLLSICGGEKKLKALISKMLSQALECNMEDIV